MHQLLLEQIQKHLGKDAANQKDLEAFFDAVNRSYTQNGTSEDKLKKIFNGTNDALIIINYQLDKIIEANPKAVELLGYDVESLLNIQYSKLHPNSLSEVNSFIQAVNDTGYGWTNEITPVTRSGESIAVEISASLIGEKQNSLMLFIIRDISSQNQSAAIISNQHDLVQQAIDINPNFVFAKDEEGKYTLANQALAKAFDTSVENLIGKKDEEFGNSFAGITGTFDQDQHVFSTGNEFTIDDSTLFNNATGEINHRQIIKRPLKDEDGNVIQVLGVINDDTALRLAEIDITQKNQSLAELADISQEISLSSDLSKILSRVTLSISKLLETASIYISDWQGDDGTSTVLAEHVGSYIPDNLRENSLGQIYNLKEDFELVHNALEQKQSLTINIDDQALPTSLKSFYEKNQCKIALYEPIILDSQSFGYIEIYEHELSSFSQNQIDQIKAFAYQLAIAFNNNALYTALQTSEQRFRSVVENTIDVITIIDPQGLIYYSNPSSESIIGYTSEELEGKVFQDFAHTDDQQAVLEGFQRAVDNPDAKRTTEFRFKHKQGHWVHLSSSSKLVVENGENQLFITTRDITNQISSLAQQKDSYDRRGKQVQFTRNLSRQIPEAQNQAELFQLVAQALQTGLDEHYHLVKIYQANQATNQLQLTTAVGNNSDNLLADGHLLKWGESIVGRTASRGTSIIIENTTEELNWVPTPFIEGTKSEIATPILLGDDVLAIIHIESTVQEDMDEDLQILLELISGQVAIALKSLRLQRDMEERLNQLNTIQRDDTAEGWVSFRKTRSGEQSGYLYEPKSEKHSPISSTQKIETGNLNKLSTPMQIRGETIGALGIQTEDNQPLDPDEQALLEEITAEVSEALERARLFEASQRSAAELAVLNKMGNAFTEALDDQSIIENIFNYASQLVDIDDFYVAIHDEEDNSIHFPLVFLDGERLTPDHPRADQWNPRAAKDGLTGYIIQNREPILIENNAEEVLKSRNLPYIQAGAMTQSWMGVPMFIGDRVLGVINAQSDERGGLYNEHHLGLFTAIASQASIAIDNARLFLQEQQRAEQERLVRTITDRVRRGADTQAILQITLEEISQALGSDFSLVKLGTDEQLLSELEETDTTTDVPKNNGASHSNGAN